tara:strand:- start:24 stop:470 length:447 start_codon:yes stop_codon:yes gene_type:complete
MAATSKRKKPRSKKQKANDKRLGRMAKARAAGKKVKKTVKKAVKKTRKATTKRRKSTNSNSPKRRKSMAGKKMLSSPLLKKAALGVGGATIAGIAAAALFPQFRNVAEPAGAYLFGGIEGIAANFALSFLKGRSGTTAQNASPAMEVL